MKILAILALVFFILMLVVSSFKFGFSKGTKTSKALHIAVLVLCFVLSASCFAGIIVPSNIEVGDAEKVAIYENDKGENVKLYYDDATNEYFIIGYSNNIFHPSHRVIFNNEKAAAYVNAYNEFKNADIIVKGG